MMALFQFMIGNSDYSAPYYHNSIMIKAGEARPVWVPYDFDWSGIVNARYAVPNPILPIRNVRERIFRGFCRPSGVDWPPIVARFQRIRDSIPPLYQGMEGLDDGRRKQALEYIDDFYKILDDPGKLDRAVVRGCRAI